VATVITCERFPDVYHEVLDLVWTKGRERVPRGLKTRDLGHTIIEVEDPTRTLAVGCGRGLSTKVAAIEALQLVAETMDENLLIKAAPQFAHFLDNGRFHGAYGRRVHGQVHAVLQKLTEDRDTRQAVITIWDPALDNLRGKHDYPCTVTMGFEQVDDDLNLRVLMRSNDAVLGLPYDVFAFSQLQCTLAHALSLRPGTYTHETWSLHLYDTDRDSVERAHAPEAYIPHLEGVGRGGEAYGSLQLTAFLLLHGDASTREATVTEEWFRKQLAPLVEDRLAED
jgi:thymidylate synthase